MMSGMAWATVGEMEPKLHQLEQSIEHGLPGKLMKIEACLGPAKQKVEDLQKQYEGQVCTYDTLWPCCCVLLCNVCSMHARIGCSSMCSNVHCFCTILQLHGGKHELLNDTSS